MPGAGEPKISGAAEATGNSGDGPMGFRVTARHLAEFERADRANLNAPI
jgi:hypothetical protein